MNYLNCEINDYDKHFFPIQKEWKYCFHHLIIIESKFYPYYLNIKYLSIRLSEFSVRRKFHCCLSWIIWLVLRPLCPVLLLSLRRKCRTSWGWDPSETPFLRSGSLKISPPDIVGNHLPIEVEFHELTNEEIPIVGATQLRSHVAILFTINYEMRTEIQK